MKKYLFLIAFCAGFYATTLAQKNIEIPKGYSFQSEKDYAQYNQLVIEAANWLKTTPLNKQTKTREKIKTFLQAWLNDNPSVQIDKELFIDFYTAKNPELLTVFMANYASYRLQNPTEKDKVKLHTEGLKAMIEAYQLGGVQEDPAYSKLKTILEEGTLAKWVAYQIHT